MAEAAVAVARKRSSNARRARRSPRGLAPTARVHAPIRSAVFAVVALAMISVFSFPALGSASAPQPSIARAAVLTPDGTDGYAFDAERDSVRVSTNPGNSSGNLRTVFWQSDAVVERDATTCATWSAESSDRLQQGVALRISSRPGGGVRAITVTKNVYPYGSWVFNVHVWDTGSRPIDPLASVNLGSVLSTPGTPPQPKPLPWRVCARAVGSTLSFKAWAVAEREPDWGDQRYGRAVQLPARAPTAGYSGWYAGHLSPGMTAVFSQLRTDAVVRTSVVVALPTSTSPSGVLAR
jgi:hypothetical protein